MINIILKCQEKTYVKKFTIFTSIQHGFWLLNVYLHPYNSWYNKSFMACTLGNSSPNSCIGSWESRYHLLELSDKHILSNLPLNTSI
jgi:hypothetical protein